MPMVTSQEVYDLLRDVEYNADLRPVHWVMNLEWHKAIRRAFPAVPGLGGNDDTLLGYYVTVTEDGGRPHLADGR